MRAITIAGTGEVHCGPGLRNLRDLLVELGAAEIPIGCGRETAGPEAYPWPDAWRAGADSGYGISFARVPGTPPRDNAVARIAEAVAGSPVPPLVLALGPWTNLQDAFEADPTLAGRIAGVYAMGGTLDAPGNLWAEDQPLSVPVEFNFGADPAAVAAVLATPVPVTLVPLDATNDVPFPPGLVDALAAEHAAAGADLVFEMYARTPFLAGEGQFLWDSLTALTLLDPDPRHVAGRHGPGRDGAAQRRPGGARPGRQANPCRGGSGRLPRGDRPPRGAPPRWPARAPVHHGRRAGRDVGWDLLRTDAGPHGSRVAPGHPGQSE